MSGLDAVRHALETLAARLLPRLLTQVCRDPHAAAYGCWDRNWWHYRIRDFPSIILQQGALALWLARDWPEHTAETRDFFSAVAGAACRFWNRRAVRYHAFEEYYPWESGYPPLAFSTLAVMKLAAGGAVSPADVREGARVAARQLLSRFEPKAANQQVVGLAALAWLRRVHPDLVPSDRWDAVKEKTLALQTSEGWFPEYGGPDLGYLSVTLDALWDLVDATGDTAYAEAAARALEFLAVAGLLSAVPRGGLGMHQARHTDYILPGGLTRFLTAETSLQRLAAVLLRRLYADADAAEHVFSALDDRYVCHYIGPSIFSACHTLRGMSASTWKRSEAVPWVAAGGMPLDAEGEPVVLPVERLFPQAGLYFRREAEAALTVSLHKGGILTWRCGSHWASDFGWIVRHAGVDFVNHWWSAEGWHTTREGQNWIVRGHLVPTRETLPSPWTHTALRVASVCRGPWLLEPLRNRLIFAQKPSILFFERRVEPGVRSLRVCDRISGVPERAAVVPAARACRRHVASAGMWHPEDATRTVGMRVVRMTRREGDIFEALTTYTPEPVSADPQKTGLRGDGAAV